MQRVTRMIGGPVGVPGADAGAPFSGDIPGCLWLPPLASGALIA